VGIGDRQCRVAPVLILGADGDQAVGQRLARKGAIADPHVEHVPVGNLLVDPRVPAILELFPVEQNAIIQGKEVRRTEVRHGIEALLHAQRDSIQPAGGNDVAGENSAGQGITDRYHHSAAVDHLREIAQAHGRGRDGRIGAPLSGSALPEVRKHEEGAIVAVIEFRDIYRSSHGDAHGMVLGDGPGRGEEVARVQGRVVVEIVNAAMDLVRTRLGHSRHDSGRSELCAVVGCVELKLRDHLQG
jgi:hypothetical protein